MVLNRVVSTVASFECSIERSDAAICRARLSNWGGGEGELRLLSRVKGEPTFFIGNSGSFVGGRKGDIAQVQDGGEALVHIGGFYFKDFHSFLMGGIESVKLCCCLTRVTYS